MTEYSNKNETIKVLSNFYIKYFGTSFYEKRTIPMFYIQIVIFTQFMNQLMFVQE